MNFENYYSLSRHEIDRIIWEAIIQVHKYHFQRNLAYRRTVSARGIGEQIAPADLPLLLRPAALTFKSYVEYLGPFPQDYPLDFVRWLSEQISAELPRERWQAFRRRYSSLEKLLADIERIYADLGLEIVTSTGTSGRASMVVRNRQTVDLAVQAFFTAIRRIWGIRRGTSLVFMMPANTRVAMARVARFGTRTLDWTSDSRVYYTMPFSATPDQMRVRAGRTFRSGLPGLLERHVLHPFMNWANEHFATPRFLSVTQRVLQECVNDGKPIMLLGGFVQLHALVRQGVRVQLPAGSRVATGGGMKERYGFSPDQIRADLGRAFPGVPISDVYGMAEANWAAFECSAGHHHIPPWVYAVVTDNNDRIIQGPVATGMLAFFDPLGGGDLIPPFFQTADRVELVNGACGYDPSCVCSCGDDSPYVRGGIRRADLVEEAGCAAQI